MNVRVIKKSNVRQTIGTNRLMLKYFEEFFDKLGYATWNKPQDITQQFKSADLITCKNGQRSRVVFNIGRNRFRMICGYWFRTKEVVLSIKFVGTHKEYNDLTVCEVDMFKK
jgi:mRNA-degrading endonuclease HigB of HigAB toxin-antitoxin module